jgi:hypothetical protein
MRSATRQELFGVVTVFRYSNTVAAVRSDDLPVHGDRRSETQTREPAAR